MLIYAIIGCGGFGREVMPIAAEMLKKKLSPNDYKLVFVVDAPIEPEVNGHHVWSMQQFLSHQSAGKYYNIAIGDSIVRQRISKNLDTAKPFSITAQSHLRLDNNKIDDSAIFCDSTIVTSNATIGRFFHANIQSYVAHDCVIGDFVTFAPAVKCNGRVYIEDHAYIGTGVTIKEGSADKPIVIGHGAVIGMGSVVTKSVAPNTLVFGAPAKFVKNL